MTTLRVFKKKKCSYLCNNSYLYNKLFNSLREWSLLIMGTWMERIQKFTNSFGNHVSYALGFRQPGVNLPQFFVTRTNTFILLSRCWRITCFLKTTIVVPGCCAYLQSNFGSLEKLSYKTHSNNRMIVPDDGAR